MFYTSMAYFEAKKDNLLVQLALQTQTCDISNIIKNRMKPFSSIKIQSKHSYNGKW